MSVDYVYIILSIFHILYYYRIQTQVPKFVRTMPSLLFSLSSPHSRLVVRLIDSGEVETNVPSGVLLPYVQDNGIG
jgi:hypothetical protein